MKKMKHFSLLRTTALFVLCIFSLKLNAAPLLNGVATHAELGKEQFIAGLFTSTLSDSAISILTSQEEKRLQVRVLARQLSSRRFKRMWIEGMAINSSPAELEKHAKNMAAFSNMLKIKMIEGDIFTVDRTADNIKVSVNGTELGEIDDPQFFDLLLRTWIGPVPLSSDFRTDLLTSGEIKPGPLARFESTRPSDERIAKIQGAVSAKQSQKSVDAPTISAPTVAAPTVPKISAPEKPAASKPKVEIAAPTIAQATPEPTTAPTPKPTPVVVAVAPTEDALDESIFEEDDDSEFTAETLLKEQLYYSQLAKYTHRFLKYPQRAWDRGREGNIRLRVTIDRTGKVKNTELLEEAKYSSLNGEAKKAVKRASPYPAMPEEISGDEYSFTFRVAFKITSK